MILDATTDSLEIILDKARTTSDMSFSVSFNEYTSTTVTPSSNHDVTNGTTAVSLISSPASGSQRQLRWCSINNVDTVDTGVKIRFNLNGTFGTVLTVFLRVGESIQYSEEMGWRTYTSSGYEKITGFQRFFPTIRMPEGFGAPNGTTTYNLGSTITHCQYLGRADRVYSSVRVHYSITVTPVNLTVAEVAIYRGTPTIQSNATLSRLGVNTSLVASWSLGGINTTTVNTTGMAIGDDLWAVFYQVSNATMGFLGGQVDHLGSGFVQSTSNRPSTTSTLSPVISTTTNMIWFAWQGVPQGT